MNNSTQETNSFDRRALVKAAAGGLIAAGMLTGIGQSGADVEAAVPSNFRAAVHVTTQDALPYAFSSLQTIADHYSKATGRLILDGDAVKSLNDQSFLDQLNSAKDNGAEIQAASDALEINGIDASTLPDYIDTSMPGVIAVLESETKGFFYFKP